MSLAPKHGNVAKIWLIKVNGAEACKFQEVSLLPLSCLKNRSNDSDLRSLHESQGGTEDGGAVRQQEPGSDHQGAAAYVTGERKKFTITSGFPLLPAESNSNSYRVEKVQNSKTST